jgi:hypothetical protein
MDPMMQYNMGDFRSQVQSMIRRRRRDPAQWQTLPFPVQYQVLGGDASKLAPVDLLNQGTEQLLNDSGVPVELYKGTLQLQTAPVALRLFEATWHHIGHDANAMLRWLVRQLSQIMSWEMVEAKLKRVTIADDINKLMAVLQLMMGQQISGTTGLRAMGLEWKAEQKQIGDEAMTQARIQAKVQEQMDSAAFAQDMAKGNVGQQGGGAGGAAPGGGGAPPPAQGGGGQPGQAPMPGPISQFIASMSPNTPVTPADMMHAADTLAQELMGQPEGVKDSELRILKQKNATLHALVRAKMDAIRSQAKSQGGQAQLQQQYGGGQGGGGAPPQQ